MPEGRGILAEIGDETTQNGSKSETTEKDCQEE